MNSTVDDSRFPLNRVIAFIGPYISIASGGIASWLIANTQGLNLFNVKDETLASWIAQGGVFLVTAVVTWAGHAKWLQGHHILLAASAGPSAPPGDGAAPADEVPPSGDEIHYEPADALRTQAAAAAPAPTPAPAPDPPAAPDPAPPADPLPSDADLLPSDAEEAGFLPYADTSLEARITADPPVA